VIVRQVDVITALPKRSSLADVVAI